MGPLRVGLRSLFTQERGSILVLGVAGFAAICAFLGLSVDVGKLLQQRAALQNAADAAVLAAAGQLPTSPSQAITDGRSWYAKNGGETSEIDSLAVTTTSTSNDTVTITAHREVDFFLAPLFGEDGAETSATAQATIYGLKGRKGLMPWGLLQTNPCFSGGLPRLGAECTIKFGSGGGGSGDYGALRLYGGSGANIYRNAVNNGSADIYRIGDRITPESGNMSGPTSQGLSDRLAREPTAGCGDGAGQDTFSEVFTVGTGGIYHLNCPDSPRVMVIPIVDQLAYPSQSTITNFVLMYLEDSPGGGDVLGRVAGVDIDPETNEIGPYTGNGLRYIRLTQ
jgi:hypothetical protein